MSLVDFVLHQKSIPWVQSRSKCSVNYFKRNKKKARMSLVQQQFQKFRLGVFILDNCKDRGRHSEVKNNVLEVFVESDPRTTV